jgi:FkbM family methyltransferase
VSDWGLWMGFKSIEWAGRALRKMGSEILRRNGIEGTWIDVGAHHGEVTLWHAQHNPGLRVYALEPNLRAAAKLMGRAPNYLVIPMAVAEKDGCADFYISTFDVASSLLPFNETALRSWIGGEGMKVDSVTAVPTIRLDTLMDLTGISTVDFLKIDAQGVDLAVLRSAGSRLKNVRKIALEVDVTPTRLYQGSAGRDETVAYLKCQGFALADVKRQSNGQEENLTFLRDPVL